MDDLDIPEFLRRQSDAWNDLPAPQPKPKPVPAPTPVAVVSTIEPTEFEVRKKIKTERRLGRMKTNLELSSIPAAFRRWDQRRSRWYDERIVIRQKLIAFANRHGITLENDDMDKLTIIPYNNDDAIERGRTQLKATAADFEVQAKLVKAANRAGLRKITRVDVVNPDGTVRESWTVDLENKLLQKVGAELTVPTTTPVTNEQETEEMAATPKKKAAAKKTAKKKAVSNARTKTASNGATRGPGVIATIVETIKRDRGASQDEIVAVLVKKFPDRTEDAMRGTVKIQANKNAKKKEKDDKRGLVYYG